MEKLLRLDPNILVKLNQISPSAPVTDPTVPVTDPTVPVTDPTVVTPPPTEQVTDPQ